MWVLRNKIIHYKRELEHLKIDYAKPSKGILSLRQEVVLNVHSETAKFHRPRQCLLTSSYLVHGIDTRKISKWRMSFS